MGIPIKLHVTFLLILPFIAFAFATSPAPLGFSGVPDLWLRIGLSLLGAILLFACVLIHELAHSYVAVHNGIKIGGITLFLFGGVSEMEDIPRNPAVEMLMAFAGPAISVVLGVVFAAIYFLVPGMQNPGSYAGTMIALLAYMNIALGVFNILPAFPMDGGRVLRGFLAERMPYIRATRIAVSIGKLFAYILALIGILTWAFGGLWFIVIALFIYMAAGEEEQATTTSMTLEGIKVKDIMTADVHTMDANATASQAIDTMFKLKHLGYPVVDAGKMVGIVTLTDVSHVPVDARATTPVRDIMTRNVITLKPDDDAFTALQKLSTNKIGRLVVMEGDRIAGIVSRTDMLKALELYEVARAGVNLPNA
ncbi:MAG TPA: CBS domain-containing protein [Methanocella sp.]|uniref:CBS domain-containing protein n=1 Tax=Methanocella sp. TaxID=2052833 RepID=UPI002C1894AF|nr:CBS domain-containing protein [Methanocella sp.]HTY91158.1 CBS domain-containing protein [Methanocella sp.]